ncbi:mitochondrial pyruvate carrier 4 isoform X1 [Prunus persica]|uniref:mitochondrial pyruvate carrier 4 isoform X1 n=1 Tax=Prunus persica TaxID=3760 RepID=UPI0009AB57AB|nr:mitochondrial pyruvate carrier 4 isoform X1 [Prunus persica]XP_034212075.1 mitochondrial pyruvate carrier 4-like isoform X1 [Prunus dulcis]
MAASKVQAFWNHPAGPKTIHFWAPTFKWGISIANIADFSKPPENISYPQQIGMHLLGIQVFSCLCLCLELWYISYLKYCFAAVTCTGLIWSRYSMVITPKNWNLFSVNVAMAGTGLAQLSRKITHDYFSDTDAAVQKE